MRPVVASSFALTFHFDLNLARETSARLLYLYRIIIGFAFTDHKYHYKITNFANLRSFYPKNENLLSVSGIWTSLIWISSVMVDWIWAQASFYYCHSCLKKLCLLQKWS